MLTIILNINKQKIYHKRKKERTSFPITINNFSESDKILTFLKNSLPSTINKNATPKTWISDTTFLLFKKKSQALKRGEKELTKTLGKELKKSLKKDRRTRTYNLSKEIETLLNNNDTTRAFDKLKPWYKFSQVKHQSQQQQKLKTSEFNILTYLMKTIIS